MDHSLFHSIVLQVKPAKPPAEKSHSSGDHFDVFDVDAEMAEINAKIQKQHGILVACAIISW